MTSMNEASRGRGDPDHSRHPCIIFAELNGTEKVTPQLYEAKRRHKTSSRSQHWEHAPRHPSCGRTFMRSIATIIPGRECIMTLQRLAMIVENMGLRCVYSQCHGSVLATEVIGESPCEYCILVALPTDGPPTVPWYHGTTVPTYGTAVRYRIYISHAVIFESSLCPAFSPTCITTLSKWVQAQSLTGLLRILALRYSLAATCSCYLGKARSISIPNH